MAAFLTLLLMALAFCLIGALLLALTVGFGFLLGKSSNLRKGVLFPRFFGDRANDTVLSV